MTPAGPLPPTVNTLRATNINPTGATLNGNITGLGSFTGATASFDWGTVPNQYGWTSESISMNGTGNFSATIQGLTPGTLYYYRVKVYCANIPYFGAESTFTTPTSTLSGPVLISPSIGEVNLNPDLVNFAWTPVENATEYEIILSPSADLRTPMGGTPAKVTQLSYRASGLQYGTVYYWSVSVSKPFTTVQSFGVFGTAASQVSVPPQVVTTVPRRIKTTNATLNGNLTVFGNSNEVTVAFEWGDSTAYSYTTPAQVMNATGNFGTMISGLAPNTTYHYRAKATGYRLSYGADQTFTTLPEPSLSSLQGKIVFADGDLCH